MKPTDEASAAAPQAVRPALPAEIVLEGTGVSRGVAIGTIYRHDAEAVSVREVKLPQGRVEAEKARFAVAADHAGRQISQLQSKARKLDGAAGEELGYLLDAYQQMLRGSRLIRGVDRRIEAERINAEAAVQREIDEIARGFEAMEDSYLAARIADIRDLGRRLIRNLTGMPYRPFQSLPRNAIILAEELTPADTALLDPNMVAGVATVLGGAESHTAIMARSLGLPAVLGVAGLMRGLRSGDTAVIDGKLGQVIVNRLRPRWTSTASAAPITCAGAARSPGSGTCRRSPAIPPASPCRPISSFRARWNRCWRPAPKVSACCARNSCS